MADLTPDHVREVCEHLIEIADTAAFDNAMIAGRFATRGRSRIKAAAERWKDRAVWIREELPRMIAQLEAAATPKPATPVSQGRTPAGADAPPDSADALEDQQQ